MSTNQPGAVLLGRDSWLTGQETGFAAYPLWYACDTTDDTAHARCVANQVLPLSAFVGDAVHTCPWRGLDSTYMSTSTLCPATASPLGARMARSGRVGRLIALPIPVPNGPYLLLSPLLAPISSGTTCCLLAPRLMTRLPPLVLLWERPVHFLSSAALGGHCGQGLCLLLCHVHMLSLAASP